MSGAVRRALASRTGRATGWMLVSQVGRFVLQAAYFVIVARTLGVTEFGVFASVAGLAGVALAFAPMGTGMLMVRDVARMPSSFPRAWGGALCATALFGSVLTGLLALIAQVALPDVVTVSTVLLIAVADVVMFNVVTIAGQTFQAHDQLRRTAGTVLALSAARCAAALAFALLDGDHSAQRWGLYYLVATGVTAVAASAYAALRLGRPEWTLREPLRRLREGFAFSLSLSTGAVYADIDKTMLARLSTLTEAGIYTAAYRLVSFAATPITALVSATYVEFFRRGGTGGVQATNAYAHRLIRVTLSYALVAAGALAAFAPLVTFVLGAEYSGSELLVRVLACVLLAQAAHLLLLNVLTGADRQGLRTTIQVVVAVANVLLNLWLIPAFDSMGAAITTIVSEYGLLVLLLVAIRRATARATRTEEVDAP